MGLVILRSAFSKIAEENNFPLGTLIVVGAVVAVAVVLLSIFRGRVSEFLRISNAEAEVDKKAKTRVFKEEEEKVDNANEFDPAKTVSMRTVDLPKRSNSRKGKVE